MIATSSKTRKRSNTRNKLSIIEQLENRRLMAGDTVEAQEFVLEVQEDVSAVVGELAEMIWQEADPRQRQILQQANDEEVFEFSEQLIDVNPDAWGQIIDQSEIPELGPLLAQSTEQHRAVSDLVIMELVDVAGEEQFVDLLLEQVVDELITELDCPQEAIEAPLPPQYEQLRQELGDEGFAQWLASNRQQIGSLSGVPEEDLGTHPDALEQFDVIERILDDWMREFAGDDTPSEPLTIPGDVDQDGEVDFGDFLKLSGNFGQLVVPGTEGDIDGDGTVGFADFLDLSSNFGETIDIDLPADLLAGNVAYQPTLFVPILFDVIVDTHQKDPLSNKATSVLIKDKLRPAQDKIEKLEKEIEGHKKALHGAGPAQANFFQGQIDQKTAEIEKAKKGVIKTQKEIQKVCGNRAAAKQVLTDKATSLDADLERQTKEVERVANDPNATTAEKQKAVNDQSNTRDEINEIKDLLK